MNAVLVNIGFPEREKTDMFEIFRYEFMRNAFIVGVILSVVIPCIGVVIVLKRLSMLGDTLSHVSLVGVAAGLITGINPTIGAIIFSILAALSIDKTRKLFSKYEEISLAVIMAAGIGIAGVLSGFVKSSASFTSFLFGSIVAVSRFELTFIIMLSIMVLFTFFYFYRELFYITFDEETAKLAGIKTNKVNFIFMLITAIAVSISARAVGALVVSSLMVVPVATAIKVAKSYKQTIIYSITFGLVSTIIGLFISYYADYKPGATIVLLEVILLILVVAAKKIIYLMKTKQA